MEVKDIVVWVRREDGDMNEWIRPYGEFRFQNLGFWALKFKVSGFLSFWVWEYICGIDFEAVVMFDEDRSPRHWCRAFFNTTSNCGIMDNNICESFNAVIVDARKKPPITMFEEMRWKLMKRIQMRRQIMDKYEHNICPKPRDTLEKNKIKSADCTPTFNGGDRFEDLTGIPCKHAVSAIYWKREAPEDYVAECYSKKTYMAIYSNFIYPINSIDMWSRCEGPAILPPSYSRMPGKICYCQSCKVGSNQLILIQNKAFTSWSKTGPKRSCPNFKAKPKHSCPNFKGSTKLSYPKFKAKVKCICNFNFNKSISNNHK
ncbi:hypothetical protein ACLB2K_045742 [Fragaria x ananassa]